MHLISFSKLMFLFSLIAHKCYCHLLVTKTNALFNKLGYNMFTVFKKFVISDGLLVIDFTFGIDFPPSFNTGTAMEPSEPKDWKWPTKLDAHKFPLDDVLIF